MADFEVTHPDTGQTLTMSSPDSTPPTEQEITQAFNQVGGSQMSQGDTSSQRPFSQPIPSIADNMEPKHTPVNWFDQFKMNFARTAEGKANILKEDGINAEATPDGQLLIGGKNYKNTPKDMTQMLKEITAGAATMGVQVAPIVAADVAATGASGGNLAAIIGANMLAASASEAGSEALANAFGAKEGYSGGQIAGAGAIQGAAAGLPFAYAGAVRGAGKGAGFLASKLEGSYPKIVKFFTGINETTSQHLVDLTKIGILPSSYLNKDFSNPEFIRNVSKKFLLRDIPQTILKDGGGEETPLNMGKQIYTLLNNAKNDTERGTLRNSLASITGLKPETIDELANNGAQKLLDPKYTATEGSLDIAGSADRAIQETNSKIGAEKSALVDSAVTAAKADQPTVDIGDIAHEAFDNPNPNNPKINNGLFHADNPNGPQVIRDGRAVNVTGSEKEALQSLANEFYGGSGGVKLPNGSIVSASDYAKMNSKLNVRAGTNPLGGTPVGSSLTEKMSPRDLLGLTNRLKRLQGNFQEGSVVGGMLNHVIDGLNSKLEGAIPGLAKFNAKYSAFHSSLRDLGMEFKYGDNVKISDALRATAQKDANGFFTDKAITAQKAWKTINGYTQVHAEKTGYRFVSEFNRMMAGRDLASADVPKAINTFMGHLQNYAGTTDRKSANVLALDELNKVTRPRSSQFATEALQHNIAKEYLSKDANLYRINKLWNIARGGSVAGGIFQLAGIHGSAAGGLVTAPAVFGLMKATTPTSLSGIAEHGFAPEWTKWVSPDKQAILQKLLAQRQLGARQSLGAIGRNFTR